MFGSLREIGEGRGFKVFYRPPKGGGSEFLLDLIWYSDGGEIDSEQSANGITHWVKT